MQQPSTRPARVANPATGALLRAADASLTPQVFSLVLDGQLAAAKTLMRGYHLSPNAMLGNVSLDAALARSSALPREVARFKRFLDESRAASHGDDRLQVVASQATPSEPQVPASESVQAAAPAGIQAPAVMEAPQSQDIRQAPRAARVSRVAGVSQATQASQPAQASQATQASQPTHASEATQASQPTQASKATQVYQGRRALRAPQALEVPQVPQVPQPTQVPQTPHAPHAPVAVETGRRESDTPTVVLLNRERTARNERPRLTSKPDPLPLPASVPAPEPLPAPEPDSESWRNIDLTAEQPGPSLKHRFTRGVVHPLRRGYVQAADGFRRGIYFLFFSSGTGGTSPPTKRTRPF
ncbi:MAG: hypothetical protein JWQ11_2874 [Rhizobacter sp.]|nr:hypothetical protein [Rhizobacter sp.]